MTDLTQRLSNATEGTRELDWGFRNAIGDDFLPFYPSSRDWITLIDGEAIGVERRGLGGSTADRYCPNYTTSLDAALALAERVLPGFTSSLVIEASMTGAQWCVSNRQHDRFSYGNTPALALCLAILSAKATDTGDLK